MPESMTAEERAEMCRRLEADAEDARKALQNAQTRFNRICDELAALRRAEREA